MALDLSKLENVKQRGGKTIAQCPACAEEGGDEKGEHLVIQPNGRFGCVTNPGQQGREHRKKIFKLAGKKSGPGNLKFTVLSAKPPKIQPTGRFGRVFQTSTRVGKKENKISDPTHIRSSNQASDPSERAQQLFSPESANNPSEASETKPPAPPRQKSGDDQPNLKPLVRSLEPTDPNFEEPRNGSLVLGLYRDDDKSVVPVLLWASTETDLFWEVAARRYVRSPRFYLPVCDTCPFDPHTGHAIVNGAICPF